MNARCDRAQPSRARRMAAAATAALAVSGVLALAGAVRSPAVAHDTHSALRVQPVQPSSPPPTSARRAAATAAAAGAGRSAGAGATTAPRPVNHRPRPPAVHHVIHYSQIVSGPDGIVYLEADSSVPIAHPVLGDPSMHWQPATPLPAPETRGRHVDIFYTPHPDDETLSMGVLIRRDVDRGDRVIVVGLTDGFTTSAWREVDRRLGAPAIPPGLARANGISVVEAELDHARVEELRAAVTALGVAPGDLFLAHLDDPSSDDGARVTVAEARQVMTAFAQRFPGATHITMSYAAERQPDHLDAGIALWQLDRARVVTDAEWTVSRLWWLEPSPPSHWMRATTKSDIAAVDAAAQAYDRWDPRDQQYAVGWLSVPNQFVALLRDPRDRVQGNGVCRTVSGALLTAAAGNSLLPPSCGDWNPPITG